MIYFESIKYKNIMSVGNSFIEISLDDTQTTLIVGKNGGGKSTMLEAVSFCLYGKPFRKITKKQIINSTNKKELETEISLRTNGNRYTIRRGIKPDFVEVYENDVKWPSEASMSETQSQIERKILRMNHKTFSQVVILSVLTFVPFMRLPAADRRKVAEDILDCDVFQRMNALLKADISDNKNALAKCEPDLELINSKIEGVISKVKALKEQNDSHITDLKKSLTDEFETMKGLDAELAEAKKIVQEFIDKNQETLDKNYERDISNLKSEIKVLKARVSPFESTMKFLSENSICPTCEQDIDEDFRKTQIDKLSEQIETARKQEKELDKKIEEQSLLNSEKNAIQGELDELRTVVGDLTHSISFVKDKIKDYGKRIEKSKISSVDTGNSDEELEGLKKKRNMIAAVHAKLQKDREILANCVPFLKDDGIKSSLIETYLPIFNKVINDYLERFELFINFNLDNTFEETIMSMNAESFSYDSFSEGERLRINIAILLAWRAVAKEKNSAATNLLIMDEILDSSMDGDGAAEFISVLKEIHQDDNIFVISHRGEGIDEKFDRVIRMRKSNGFTIMEEND